MVSGKEMFGMKLFDHKEVRASSGVVWNVLRVPGGWIMREANVPSPAYAFVPLDNEFQDD
jgi:hypothetical protein